MQNYGQGNSGLVSLIIKGILALVAIVILIQVFKTIIAVVISALILGAIVIGILALLKYLGRDSRRY